MQFGIDKTVSCLAVFGCELLLIVVVGGIGGDRVGDWIGECVFGFLTPQQVMLFLVLLWYVLICDTNDDVEVEVETLVKKNCGMGECKMVN